MSVIFDLIFGIGMHACIQSTRGRPKVNFSPSAEVGTFPQFFLSEVGTFRSRKVIGYYSLTDEGVLDFTNEC